MKANNLRIGNWVHGYCITFKIGSINEIHVEPIGGNEGEFDINELEGIELSPEIL